jgi:hypothetical protein
VTVLLPGRLTRLLPIRRTDTFCDFEILEVWEEAAAHIFRSDWKQNRKISKNKEAASLK